MTQCTTEQKIKKVTNKLCKARGEGSDTEQNKDSNYSKVQSWNMTFGSLLLEVSVWEVRLNNCD